MPRYFKWKKKSFTSPERAAETDWEAWRAHITLVANFAVQAAENRILTTPLHIVEHLGGRWCYCQWGKLLRSDWGPTTHEVVYNDSNIEKSHMILHQFYSNRSVVRFSASCGYDSSRVEQLATAIHSCLNQSFPPFSQTYRIRPGRLHLCGVPALVLPSDELLAAENKANEVAKLKVFEALSTMVIKYGTRATWEAYNSRIHFVNPGFRPTLADLAED
jgi:hypothetical protein